MPYVKARLQQFADATPSPLHQMQDNKDLNTYQNHNNKHHEDDSIDTTKATNTLTKQTAVSI